MDLGAAIDALETVLAVTGEDAGENMGKAHLMVGGNDVLQAIGGAVPSEGICGTKTWVNVSGKSQTVVLLFSLTDGALLCVVEATAMGQLDDPHIVSQQGDGAHSRRTRHEVGDAGGQPRTHLLIPLSVCERLRPARH